MQLPLFQLKLTRQDRLKAISKAQKYSRNNYWKYLQKNNFFSKKLFLKLFFSKEVFF